MAKLRITPLRGGQIRLEFKETSHDVYLPTLCTDDDYQLLRWYFEDYAEDDPFQASKAEEAQDLVSTYGRKLVQGLALSQLDFELQAVHIQVLQGHSEDLFWEALEQPGIWPSTSRVGVVTVTRCVACETSPIDTVCLYETKEVINILVVIARPQLDQDIPHRFVSSTIVKVADLTLGKARVEIVRPGTFDGFEDHLGSRPKGFFDIVHFDMHGEATTSLATLSFLRKSRSGDELTLTTDPRNAKEVSEVLVRNGVKYAVLNACQSAIATGSSDSNIAATLVNYGMLAVVAMSYKIASSAVDQMVRTFYDAVLLGGFTLAEGLRVARAAMQEHPAKKTQFGITVNVLDYLVPRCFQSPNLDDRPLVESRVNPTPPSSTVADSSQNVIGRENDILLLESMLLMDSNIGVLKGEPGVGKTSLMNNVGQWWLKTFLIEGVAYLNVDSEDLKDKHEAIDMANIEAYVARSVLGSSDRASEIVEYLNKTRHLIIIDHLESWKVPEGGSKRTEQKRLKTFLGKVHGGQSFFVFVSRGEETWLEKISGVGKRAFSQRMSGLVTTRATRLFVAEVSFHDGPALALERVTLKYLEGLVKLVDGNPLALKMLAYDFAQKNVSVRSYMAGLLEGAGIDYLPDQAESNDGARTIRQLRDYCEKCENEISNLVLAAILNKHLGLDEANKDTTQLKPPLHPAALGMFWGFMPMEDLWKYVLFASVGTLSDPARMSRAVGSTMGFDATPTTPSGLEEKLFTAFILSLSVSEKSGSSSGQQSQLKPAISAIQGQIHKLIGDLHELNLVNPAAAKSSQDRPRKLFYGLSPILTVYIRSRVDFQRTMNALQGAFVLFQLQSCFSFPTSSFYWKDEWEDARREIGLNFNNLYGALLAAVHSSPGITLFEWAIFLLSSNVGKGLFSDKSCYELLSFAFEEMLTRGLGLLVHPPTGNATVAAVLCSQIDSVSGVVSRLGSSQEVLNFILRCVVLIETTLAGTVFRTGMFDGSRGLHDSLETTLRPHVESTLALLGSLNHPYAELGSKVLEYSWQGLTADVSDPEAFWTMRERYFTWVASRNGDEVPHDQFRARVVPHTLNSLTLSGSPALEVHAIVASLRKQKRFNEARRVVRCAMAKELATGSNQAATRIVFLGCLVAIDKDDEQWDDAIANTNLAHQLRDSLPGLPLTLEERITREHELAYLHNNAGDTPTTQHLLRSLLRRANNLHTTNIPLELKTLTLLSQLPLVRRLDGDVSAIYLLVRAMLLIQRNLPSPSSLAATTFQTTMDLTNNTQPIWVLGPSDWRPQSLAIFFLSTLLGQMVFPMLSTRVFLHHSPAARALARGMGMAEPKSLGEYAALNMIVTLQSLFMPGLADRVMGQIDVDGEDAYSVECMEELSERLFRPPGWRAGTGHFEGLELEQQRLFFDHFYTVGETWLAGGTERRDLPATPWTPATVFGDPGPIGSFPGGTPMPRDYKVPTEMILRLAGYIVDDD
ncbi:hypothetical protein B0H67DRAFT_550890 [Lasiosphaeris hirsuta]|uniref:CHAT domain-containing protein n=1 Tax=Lasiosphaeris hirsuta TaxID=260670 RepID=A0AA40E505_9PEZI|nr:hypothetical protein B0H67DRAFT_550890 [Lasiosphaeris hirsuta]